MVIDGDEGEKDSTWRSLFTRATSACCRRDVWLFVEVIGPSPTPKAFAKFTMRTLVPSFWELRTKRSVLKVETNSK